MNSLALFLTVFIACAVEAVEALTIVLAAGLTREWRSTFQGMADSDPAADGWLLLVYRVPPEPSRLRSAVWRRLKSLGAIYLQNSAAALPVSVGAERALRKLRSEILDMGGTAVLLSCSVLAGATEVHAAFQAARDDEYEEIVDRC